VTPAQASSIAEMVNQAEQWRVPLMNPRKTPRALLQTQAARITGFLNSATRPAASRSLFALHGMYFARMAQWSSSF